MAAQTANLKRTTRRADGPKNMTRLLFPPRQRTIIRAAFLASLGSALWFASACLSAANWPAWRGVDGLGTITDTGYPMTWSPTENVRWKTPLPGPGNSSPVVWGEKVFITQAVAKENRRTVTCFDRRSGKQLWQSGVAYTEPEPSHETNPHCSASPVTDGTRVIAWFGSAGVYCYDFAGKELWHRSLGKQEHEWGYGTSPVLHEDVCILNFGPGPRAFLIAFDKATGATKWQIDNPEITPKERTDGFRGEGKGVIGTWATPIIVKANGRDELIVGFPEKVRAFAPVTGKELWSCDGLNPLVYASPMYADGLAVVMGGYYGNTVAVKPGGNGEVTATHRVWHQTRAKSGIGTGIIHDGHIYQMYSSMGLCQELKTGKIVWDERLQGSGANSESWSSMIRLGDTIFILNHQADTIVLRASPKFEKIGVNSLGGERANSTIAASDGEFFIRTHEHLWCISKSKPGPSASAR